jgi:hypothetical protein
LFLWTSVSSFLKDKILTLLFTDDENDDSFCLLITRQWNTVHKLFINFCAAYPDENSRSSSVGCWKKGTKILVRQFEFLSLVQVLGDSSVGIALGYGLDDRGSRIRFPAGAGNFSLHHRVQNGSGAHPASYPVGTSGFSLGVKRPGRKADHSPPSSPEVKEWVELYLHSPNTPSWRGAQLKAQG